MILRIVASLWQANRQLLLFVQSEKLVSAVTKRRLLGLLARAQGNPGRFRDLEDLGFEFRPRMRTVAERLLGRETACAVGVLAYIELEHHGAQGGDFRFIHGMILRICTNTCCNEFPIRLSVIDKNGKCSGQEFFDLLASDR